jgi:phospholipase C
MANETGPTEVWGSIGATVVDGGHPYAFVVGSDKHLWVDRWNGQAWSWSDLGQPGSGGDFVSVGVVTVDGGRPYAFVVGTDGHLWVCWWSGQAWSWSDLGMPASGAISSALSVTVVDGSRPHVFVRGHDFQLWVCWWSGQAWSWSALGHDVGNRVGAVTVDGSRPYVFVTGRTDQHVWQATWTGQAWSWSDQGLPASAGMVRGAVGVVTVGTNTYAFVIGIDGHLWLNYWTGRAWAWSDQGMPGSGKIPHDNGIGATFVGGRVYAFVRGGGDGHLWVNYWNGRAWSWSDLGLPASGRMRGAVGVVTVDGNRPYVFVLGSDGHLWLNCWTGQAWSWSDLGLATRPPPPHARKKVSINSAAFTDVCLRLDGAGVTQPMHDGGVVNCQFTAEGPKEIFYLIRNTDNTVSFESTAFPNVFLRMDGTNPQAGGVVNAQYTAGPWEKFILVDQGNGQVGIKSASFQDCWLYMDGGGINHQLPNGGGDVHVYKVSGNTGGPLAKFILTPESTALTRIQHVFVLMLENHSFDCIFGQSGISGITHATTGYANTANGTVYHVATNAPSALASDPGHEFQDVVAQLAGANATYPAGGPYPAINNAGFAFNYATSTTEGDPPPSSSVGDIMKGFNTPTQLPVIYQLATEFALCDHWFSSLPGPTWPNRFFVHGASSAGLDHSPSRGEITQWDTVDGFGYPNGNIYQRLTSVGRDWRIYNDDTNAYNNSPPVDWLGGQVPQVLALKSIGVSDIQSLTHFANDLRGFYPYNYTFIEPNYGDVVNASYQHGSSQHPMDSTHSGEALIKAVYEAIRNSSVWTSSLLIITYDEHGGLYDSVAPGAAMPPADGSASTYNQWGFKFDQLGVRVPAVIVSPWIARGVVDDTVYDHSSVAATLERIFDLAPLTARDNAANDVLHLLQSSMRTDTPTTLNNPSPAPAVAAATAAFDAADATPLKETGNQPGFLAIHLKADLELSPGDLVSRQTRIERFKQIKTVGEARTYVREVSAKIRARKAKSLP